MAVIFFCGVFGLLVLIWLFCATADYWPDRDAKSPVASVESGVLGLNFAYPLLNPPLGTCPYCGQKDPEGLQEGTLRLAPMHMDCWELWQIQNGCSLTGEVVPNRGGRLGVWP